MPRPSKRFNFFFSFFFFFFFSRFKLHMDQTRPPFAILWSHANYMNIACVLIGWQSPTHICQSFTRQIRVYQHEKVGENAGENRDEFYFVANSFPTGDCFCVVHTHQLQFANTSLPTLVCRVRAALKEMRGRKMRVSMGRWLLRLTVNILAFYGYRLRGSQWGSGFYG